jgi:predicted N-acyltransferase
MNYQTTIYETVGAIPAEEWDSLCAPAGEVFMDRRVLAAVERSMAAEGKFQFLVLRDAAGQAMACAAVSLYRIDGAVLASGILKKFVHGVRRVWNNYLRMKILFCGLPVSGGQKSLLLDPAADAESVAAELDRVLKQLARRHGAWFIVFKECDEADLPRLDRLQDHGYLRGDSLPMNHFEPRFRDLNDFCQALRSHYRYKINKSLKKFTQAGLRLETLVEPQQILDAYTDEVHRLYVAVVDRAEHKLEILPAEFFREMVRRLPGEMSLSLVLQEDRIVAFAWGLMHAGVFQNLFIGVDYSLNTDVDLYFNTMLRSIDFGLRGGATDIFVGQSADDFKSRVGCYHRPRYIYLKATNRLFHALVRRLKSLVLPPAAAQPQRDLFKPSEAEPTVAAAPSPGSNDVQQLDDNG